MRITFKVIICVLLLSGCRKGEPAVNGEQEPGPTAIAPPQKSNDDPANLQIKIDLESCIEDFLLALRKRELPDLMDMFADEITIYGKPSGGPVEWDMFTIKKENGFNGFLEKKGFLYWVLYDTDKMIDYVHNSGEIFPGFFGEGDYIHTYSFKEAIDKADQLKANEFQNYLNVYVTFITNWPDIPRSQRIYYIYFNTETGLVEYMGFH